MTKHKVSGTLFTGTNWLFGALVGKTTFKCTQLTRKSLAAEGSQFQINYRIKMNQQTMRSRIGVKVNVARTALGGGSSSGAPPPVGHARKGITSSRGSSTRSLSTRCPTPPPWSTRTRPRSRSSTLGGASVSERRSDRIG